MRLHALLIQGPQQFVQPDPDCVVLSVYSVYIEGRPLTRLSHEIFDRGEVSLLLTPDVELQFGLQIKYGLMNLRQRTGCIELRPVDFEDVTQSIMLGEEDSGWVFLCYRSARLFRKRIQPWKHGFLTSPTLMIDHA